jgi:hypothetical protein
MVVSGTTRRRQMGGSISSIVTLIWTAFGSSQTVLGRVSVFVDKSLPPALSSPVILHRGGPTSNTSDVRDDLEVPSLALRQRLHRIVVVSAGTTADATRT